MLFWSRCLVVIALSGLCSARLLRVPKVYNAIINSSDNLAPSRAFPLIQPVVHETPFGYPYSPVVYHQPPLPFVPPQGLPPRNDDPQRGPPLPPPQLPPQEGDKPEEGVDQNPAELPPDYPPQLNPIPQNYPQQPQPESPKPNQEKPNPNQPQDNPLKLNEFGLPPSLIPVQQYTPRITYPYDPYPFYTDPYTGALLPYSGYNPYFPTPYSFNPYPFYAPQPQDVPFQQPGPQGPQQPPPQQQPSPPPQQPEVNIKNNANKNSNIPDVPPPPLPTAGLRKSS